MDGKVSRTRKESYKGEEDLRDFPASAGSEDKYMASQLGGASKSSAGDALRALNEAGQ